MININNIKFIQDDEYDDSLIKRYNVIQNTHEHIEDLVSSIGDEKIILDIDLDVFNKSTYFLNGDLWSDDDIITYIKIISNLILQAEIITIAMSYGYSGTDKQREHLIRLVVPEIIRIKTDN